MHPTEKKLILQNSIKFVIGTVLLICSYMYLEVHQAEKASIISWFKIMAQKIQIIWYQIIGKDSQLLDEKYKLEKFYQEMADTIKHGNCIDKKALDTINEKLSALDSESLENFKINYALYNNFAYERDEKIKNTCLKSN